MKLRSAAGGKPRKGAFVPKSHTSKSRGRKPYKNKDPSAPQQERAKTPAIISCTCGYEGDDGLMVQCDECAAWQHAKCMGLAKKSLVNVDWFCPDCDVITPAKLIKRSQRQRVSSQPPRKVGPRKSAPALPSPRMRSPSSSNADTESESDDEYAIGVAPPATIENLQRQNADLQRQNKDLRRVERVMRKSVNVTEARYQALEAEIRRRDGVETDALQDDLDAVLAGVDAMDGNNDTRAGDIDEIKGRLLAIERRAARERAHYAKMKKISRSNEF